MTRFVRDHVAHGIHVCKKTAGALVRMGFPFDENDFHAVDIWKEPAFAWIEQEHKEIEE